MVWLIVALISWPIVSIAVGLLLGRALARCDATAPHWLPGLWVRRELPPDVVAPLPQDRHLTRI